MSLSSAATPRWHGRPDLLLSTLANYLAGRRPQRRVVVTLDGHDVELPMAAPK